MSMGSLLLAAGAEGKRMALPNSRILIHQPSAGYEGQSSDIEIHAREILKTRKRIDEIYARHTGQSEEQVNKDMERDRFFSSEQAVEYGLIDRVLEPHYEGRFHGGVSVEAVDCGCRAPHDGREACRWHVPGRRVAIRRRRTRSPRRGVVESTIYRSYSSPYFPLK